MRSNPLYYIAPSAVSVTANANDLASDLAVYLARDAKIKVYYPGYTPLEFDADGNYQEWSLKGRNRRLKNGNGPYTIYARLSKTDKTGYLVFAPQTWNPSTGKWRDKYYSIPIQGYSPSELDNQDYWYVKMGTVSAVTGGARTVNLDTGILGTDQYNNEWQLYPDSLPLRVELATDIDDKGTGSTPYVAWGETLKLTPHLVQGWENDASERLHHWTIERNTGDAVADAAWNAADHSGLTEDGYINLRHIFGGVDDFNEAVSAVFTVKAWGIPAGDAAGTVAGNPEADATDTVAVGDDSSGESGDDSSDSDDSGDDSGDSSDSSGEEEYVVLAYASITILAETVATYDLQLSADAMTYDPKTQSYSPNSITAQIRATAEDGTVTVLTQAQIILTGLSLYAAPTDLPEPLTPITPISFVNGVATLSSSLFSAHKNMNLWLQNVGGTELYKTTIAFVTNGEDGVTYDIRALDDSGDPGNVSPPMDTLHIGSDETSVDLYLTLQFRKTTGETTAAYPCYLEVYKRSKLGVMTMLRQVINQKVSSYSFSATGQNVITTDTEAIVIYISDSASNITTNYLASKEIPVIKDGDTGTPGADGVTYPILSTVPSVTLPYGGTVALNTTLTFQKKEGANAAVARANVYYAAFRRASSVYNRIASGRADANGQATLTATVTSGVSSDSWDGVVVCTYPTDPGNAPTHTGFDSEMEIQVLRQGAPGQNITGDTGPIPIPYGVFDPNSSYTRTSDIAPYVAEWNSTTSKYDYYILMTTGTYSSSTPPSVDAASANPSWQLLPSFQQLMAEVLIANMGTLGAWVFWGNYMFSAQGYAGTLGQPAPAGGSFYPNLWMDAASGAMEGAAGNFKLGADGSVDIAGMIKAKGLSHSIVRCHSDNSPTINFNLLEAEAGVPALLTSNFITWSFLWEDGTIPSRLAIQSYRAININLPPADEHYGLEFEIFNSGSAIITIQGGSSSSGDLMTLDFWTDYKAELAAGTAGVNAGRLRIMAVCSDEGSSSSDSDDETYAWLITDMDNVTLS